MFIHTWTKKTIKNKEEPVEDQIEIIKFLSNQIQSVFDGDTGSELI